MTTKEFIEKAIEGGWKQSDIEIESGLAAGLISRHYYLKTIGQVLLDPKAWEAVGRVEGWTVFDDGTEEAHQIMHRMIDHLLSGGDITSYLETL